MTIYVVLSGPMPLKAFFDAHEANVFASENPERSVHEVELEETSLNAASVSASAYPHTGDLG